jgi:hypothetical protein
MHIEPEKHNSTVRCGIESQTCFYLSRISSTETKMFPSEVRM